MGPYLLFSTMVPDWPVVRSENVDVPSLGHRDLEEVDLYGVAAVHDQRLFARSVQELGVEGRVFLVAGGGHLPRRRAHREFVRGIGDVEATIRRAGGDDGGRWAPHL